MAAIDIPVVGERFLGDRPGVARMVKASIGEDASNDVVLSAQEASAVFNVPAGTLVLEVLLIVNTAFTATTTIEIGDGTDPNGWLDSAKIDPDAAETAGKLKRSTLPTAEAYAGGKLYESADTIDVTVGVADVDAGQADVYVIYIPNEGSL